MHIEQVLGEKVKTMAFYQADTEEQVAEDIEKAVASGCSVIFTTAVQMVNQSVRSAILHPDVKIYALRHPSPGCKDLQLLHQYVLLLHLHLLRADV